MASKSHRPPRPWYAHRRLTDEYRAALTGPKHFKMLRAIKLVRSLIVNLGIIGITLYALVATNADPTVVATIGLVVLGAYNGVEVADYAALAQAFAEISIETKPRDVDQQDDDERQ